MAVHEAERLGGQVKVLKGVTVLDPKERKDLPPKAAAALWKAKEAGKWGMG
jgi:hypothetical protein